MDLDTAVILRQSCCQGIILGHLMGHLHKQQQRLEEAATFMLLDQPQPEILGRRGDFICESLFGKVFRLQRRRLEASQNISGHLEASQTISIFRGPFGPDGPDVCRS